MSDSADLPVHLKSVGQSCLVLEFPHLKSRSQNPTAAEAVKPDSACQLLADYESVQALRRLDLSLVQELDDLLQLAQGLLNRVSFACLNNPTAHFVVTPEEPALPEEN